MTKDGFIMEILIPYALGRFKYIVNAKSFMLNWTE